MDKLTNELIAKVANKLNLEPAHASCKEQASIRETLGKQYKIS